MTQDRQIGKVEAVPAGDEETAKHPANDPVVGATGEEGANEPRDREARLAQDAGARRSGGGDSDGSYLQQESEPAR